MNIVTKIFIVLTLVCSIVLSVFASLTLGTARELRTALDFANQGNRQAGLMLVAERARTADLQNSMDKIRLSYNDELKSLNDKIVAQVGQNTSLMARLASTQAQLETEQGSNSRAAVTMAAQQGALDLQNKELAALRPEVVRLQREMSETNLTNDQLTTKLDTAERAIKNLQEKVAEAMKHPTAASGTMVGGAPVLTTGIVTMVPVNGRVTDVKADNGKTYLALSLGERDNILVGTRFTISRGEKYVGDAIVERVTPDQSVAVLKTGNPLPVQVNDIVSSGPQ